MISGRPIIPYTTAAADVPYGMMDGAHSYQSARLLLREFIESVMRALGDTPIRASTPPRQCPQSHRADDRAEPPEPDRRDSSGELVDLRDRIECASALTGRVAW